MQDEKGHQGFVVTLVDTSDQEAKAKAGAALYRHNVERTGVDDRAPIGAKLTDPASGAVLGGLWGRTELGLLFLSMFVLPKSIRGRSLGSQLISAVEEEAKRRGCERAVVETSTFQAPGFYERHGYEEFGRVEFGVPGHARVWLRKSLG